MNDINDMTVNLLSYPTEADWIMCRNFARVTARKDKIYSPVTEKFKSNILKSGHSPIRTLNYVIEMYIPYYISVHFCRHSVGVTHFVSSQRCHEDREERKQGEFVTHIMYLNVEALKNIILKRRCSKADKLAQLVAVWIRDEVVRTDRAFKDSGIFEMPCKRFGICNEFEPCSNKGAFL